MTSLIYGVMVIKGYNSKASLFATASVSRDFSHFSFPTPFKIISQVMFFSVFFNATNKNFSTVQWAPGLWESSLEVPSGPQLPSTLRGLAFMAAPASCTAASDKPGASERLVFGPSWPQSVRFPTAHSGSSDSRRLFQSSVLCRRASAAVRALWETLT